MEEGAREVCQSEDALGHLCRQVGSLQAHIGVGRSIVFRVSEEIDQLSMGLMFSPLQFGHISIPSTISLESKSGPRKYPSSKRQRHRERDGEIVEE